MGVIIVVMLISLCTLISLAFFMLGQCRQKKKELIRLREELRTAGMLTKEYEKELNDLINSCPYLF